MPFEKVWQHLNAKHLCHVQNLTLCNMSEDKKFPGLTFQMSVLWSKITGSGFLWNAELKAKVLCANWTSESPRLERALRAIKIFCRRNVFYTCNLLIHTFRKQTRWEHANMQKALCCQPFPSLFYTLRTAANCVFSLWVKSCSLWSGDELNLFLQLMH